MNINCLKIICACQLNYILNLKWILIISIQYAVHAGINSFKDLDKQILTDLVWICWEFFDTYKSKAKVAIGHTSTQNINSDNKPIILPNNIIMVDTGSWRSYISVFNINDNNYWQDTIKVKVKELK